MVRGEQTSFSPPAAGAAGGGSDAAVLLAIDDDELNAAVLRMLTAMVDVQEILHATKDDSFLSLDECDKVEALVDTFLLEYQKLAAAADVAKVWLWNNVEVDMFICHLAVQGLKIEAFQ